MLRVSLFLAAVRLSSGAQGLAVSSTHDTQLTPEAIGDFTAVGFASAKRTTSSTPDCKSFPGDESWPPESEWSRLNKTLGGALLNPLPAASACYSTSPNFNAETCSFLLNNASRTTFYLDDPLTILTQWPQGNTCLISQNPTGTCTQGGYPVYVVNATNVKQVQAAVNFARNKDIRLVIKFVFP
jgi:hypothetical protein